jgi:DNA-binding GntR family transcriptional regulator
VERLTDGSWLIAGAPTDGQGAATIRERIGRILRERVLTGELVSGSRLDLDALAAEFGTSRTPVREACLELMHDGLVRIVARSGVVVLGQTAEGTQENFELMAALSGVAAEWAAARIEPAELRRVTQLDLEMSLSAAAGDDITAANWMFHREVNRACKSPRLLAMIGAAGRMIPRSFLDVFPEHIECSLEEHRELVRALTRRDGLSARRVAEQHLRAASSVLVGKVGHSAAKPPMTGRADERTSIANML